MLPIIPIVAAVTSAAILIQRRIKRDAKRNAQKSEQENLIAYVKSVQVPLDSHGRFNPNAILENGNPLLFDVMMKPNLVESLLVYGADPNIRDTDGIPAIVYAAKIHYSSNEQISSLLNHGANPNAMDPEGKTAIFHTKSPTILKLLAEAGADFDAVDNTGKPALFYMLDKFIDDFTSETALDDFMSNMANPDICNKEGVPALIYATQSKNADKAVWILLRKEANPNVKDIHGKTAIFYAKSQDTLKNLRYAGANFRIKDNEGKTALFYSHDNPEIMDKLIQLGTPVDEKDKDGKTVLFYATGRNTLKALNNAGADFNARDNTGKTALFYSFEKQNTLDLVQFGCDINAKDNEMKTVAFYIPGKESFHIVKKMVAKGLNLEATDNKGEKFKYYDAYKTKLRNDLYEAVKSNDFYKADQAVMGGADPNTKVPGKTWNLLHIAIEKNSPDMIALLARAGADLNDSSDGLSPLKDAIYKKRTTCFQKLLELGADPKPAKDAVKYEGNYKIKAIFKMYYSDYNIVIK